MIFKFQLGMWKRFRWFIHFSNNVPEEICGDQHVSTVDQENEAIETKISCQQCKKSFPPKTILRHISNNKICKKFYCHRLNVLKRQNDTKRKRKYRSDLKIKEELKRQTEKIAYEKKSQLIRGKCALFPLRTGNNEGKEWGEVVLD